MKRYPKKQPGCSGAMPWMNVAKKDVAAKNVLNMNQKTERTGCAGIEAIHFIIQWAKKLFLKLSDYERDFKK